jgi:hypothetical protein
VSAASGVVSDRTFHMSLLAAKLPRANYIWFMLFLQPITQCALMLVSQSPDKPGHYVIGAIAFIIAQVVSLGLTLQLTGKRLRAVYIARPWAVGPEEAHLAEVPAAIDEADLEETAHIPPANCVARFFVPRGDWYAGDSQDIKAKLHHSTYKPLYAPFHFGGRLFLFADVGMAILFGAVAAMWPNTSLECVIQLSVIFGATMIYLLVVLVVRPFAVPMDNLVITTLATMEAFSAWCVLMVVIEQRNGNTGQWAKNAADLATIVTTWVTFGAMLKDCIIAILHFYTKRKATLAKARDGHPDQLESVDEANDAANPIKDVFACPDAAAEQRILEALANWDRADDWLQDEGNDLFEFTPAGCATGVLYDATCGMFFDSESGFWYDARTDKWTQAAEAQQHPDADANDHYEYCVENADDDYEATVPVYPQAETDAIRRDFVRAWHANLDATRSITPISDHTVAARRLHR